MSHQHLALAKEIKSPTHPRRDSFSVCVCMCDGGILTRVLMNSKLSVLLKVTGPLLLV